MLTDKEVEKLKNRDPATYKANDFIVRRKFQKWLDGLFVVSTIILRYLPERQLKRLTMHDHIIELGQILIQFLDIYGAVPIIQKSEWEHTVVIPNHAPRCADSNEIDASDQIMYLISMLFLRLSEQYVLKAMQEELDHYHPEYIIVKRAFDEYPKPS